MIPPMERARAGWWAAWLAAGLALLAALPGNGEERPLEEHEAFVARSAEEMTRDGSWLIGRFGGEWRLEKPPVNYWLAQAAHRLLGGERVSEFQARLPSVLAAAALAFLIFHLGTAAFGDRRAGAAAALLWATSNGFAVYARNARPEMVYALLCGVLVLGLLRAARAGAGTRAGWAWALLGWSAAGLAVLTKGPYLPVFMAAGALLGIWAGRRRPGALDARALHALTGGLLVAAVTAGYSLGVRAAVPEAFELWRAQMFDRVGGGGPAWLRPLEMYYVYAGLPLFLPWLLPLALAVPWTWRQRGGAAWMLAGVALVTGLVLSFSDGRRAYYLLPVLPCVHCLMGAALVDWYDRARAAGRSAALSRALVVHALLLAAAGLVLLAVVLRGPRTPAAPLAAVLAAAGALASAALTWRTRRARPAAAFAWLALGLAGLQAGMAAACVGWSSDRFTKATFARELALLVAPEVPLLGLGGAREIVIYYADRAVPRVRERNLAQALAATPGALVVARRSDLDEGTLVGQILLSEESLSGGDPMVLVRPDPDPGRGDAPAEGQVPQLDQRTGHQAGDEDRVPEPQGVGEQ